MSSFFFPGNNEVVISSYGRGLWTLKYTCNVETKSSQRKILTSGGPFIYHNKARIPLGSIKDPILMPSLRYFLVKGGDILDYKINRENNVVEEVVISAGDVFGYNWDGSVAKVSFKVRIDTGQGTYGGDVELLALLREKVRVKGMMLEKDTFKAPILSEKEILPEQLPKQSPPAPYVSIMNRRAGIATVEGIEKIRLFGRNFTPKEKLDIYLDGEKVKLATEPVADEAGSFVLLIPQMLGQGGHTILVKQLVGKDVIQDVASFVKTVIVEK